ncbi:MAG: hypothetical protein U1A27_09100 [Phycisphaerae bacterium]
MRPEDIIERLRTQPFEPFRIYMTDGQTYDVRHPELVIVDRTKLHVFVPGPRGLDAPIRRTHYAALMHVVRIAPLNGHEARRGRPRRKRR